jgi:hypothetical protein
MGQEAVARQQHVGKARRIGEQTINAAVPAGLFELGARPVRAGRPLAPCAIDAAGGDDPAGLEGIA